MGVNGLCSAAETDTTCHKCSLFDWRNGQKCQVGPKVPVPGHPKPAVPLQCRVRVARDRHFQSGSSGAGLVPPRPGTKVALPVWGGPGPALLVLPGTFGRYAAQKSEHFLSLSTC